MKLPDLRANGIQTLCHLTLSGKRLGVWNPLLKRRRGLKNKLLGNLKPLNLGSSEMGSRLKFKCTK